MAEAIKNKIYGGYESFLRYLDTPKAESFGKSLLINSAVADAVIFAGLFVKLWRV